MITAKPLKRKHLAPNRAINRTSPGPHMEASRTLPAQHEDAIRTLSLTDEKVIDGKLFSKLVYETITLTGGITSRQCDQLIKEFAKRRNWRLDSNSLPNINSILKDLLESNRISKILINGTNRFFKRY